MSKANAVSPGWAEHGELGGDGFRNLRMWRLREVNLNCLFGSDLQGQICYPFCSPSYPLQLNRQPGVTLVTFVRDKESRKGSKRVRK